MRQPLTLRRSRGSSALVSMVSNWEKKNANWCLTYLKRAEVGEGTVDPDAHSSIYFSLSSLLFSVWVSHWFSSLVALATPSLPLADLATPGRHSILSQRTQQKSWVVIQPLCMSSQVSVTDHCGRSDEGGHPQVESGALLPDSGHR